MKKFEIDLCETLGLEHWYRSVVVEAPGVRAARKALREDDRVWDRHAHDWGFVRDREPMRRKTRGIEVVSHKSNRDDVDYTVIDGELLSAEDISELHFQAELERTFDEMMARDQQLEFEVDEDGELKKVG